MLARSVCPNLPAAAATPRAASTRWVPISAASWSASAIVARTLTVPAAEASISQVLAPSPRVRNAASASVRAFGLGTRGAPSGSWGCSLVVEDLEHIPGGTLLSGPTRQAP